MQKSGSAQGTQFHARIRPRTVVLLGVVAFIVLTNSAHAAGGGREGADVFDLTVLGEGTRLLLYGLLGLGLALVSLAVPDAPLLVYLFSMSIAEFTGLRVGLAVMQCLIVLFRTWAPRNLLPSLPFSLFLLCMVASASWALDPHQSFFGDLTGVWAMLLQIPVTVATMAALRSRLTTLNRLLVALVVGAVPGCIRTIQNALAGVRFLEDNSPRDQNQYYMGFIPPDIFSTILILTGIFLLFWLTSSETSRRTRVLAGSVLPLICVALLLSGIRSGWIGFGLAALLLLARKRSVAAWSTAAAVLAIVVLVGLSPVAGLNIKDKMASRLSEGSMSTGESRLQFWEVAAQGFAKRPVLGIGWGCFPEFAADNALGNEWATHNIFVRVSCELGAVGFLLFAAWILATALRIRHSSMGGLVGLLMVGVLVQGLFVDHFICSQFWMFLGLCEGVPSDWLPRTRAGFELGTAVPEPHIIPQET